MVAGVPGLVLREAGPGDVHTIMAFIRGLAVYEKLEHEMVATEEGMTDALFGPQPAAWVILADYEGVPAGFALYFFTFSTFLGRRGIYLEDLFVLPEHRGRGIGGALLANLAAIAAARGCGRLEWSVLDWNEPAIRFYRSLGAVGMDGWTVNRVTGEALDRLAASVTFAEAPEPGRR